MIKLSAISPRTNAFMQSGGEGSPEEMAFEKIFSSMAYAMLESKAPKLVSGIITFKIIESDIDSGRATGVFIGQKGPSVIYIPMVLVDSTVKPPEMFYSKEVDAFMPLTEGWLNEVEKIDSSAMGESMEAPDSMVSNPDIRGITTPPQAGRFSYASADLKVPSPNLTKILSESGNTTKTAFSNLLKENKDCLKSAVKYHGNKIVESLKLSSAPTVESPEEWWVLSPRDSAEKFAAAFGNNAGEAYQEALLKGVVVKETRKFAAVAVSEETPLKTHLAPTDSGIYKIVDTTGKVSVVAIFKNPADISGDSYGQDKYLVVFPNGKYARTKSVVAIDTEESLPDGPLRKALSGEGRPLRRGKQVLVKGGGIPSATLPVNISVLSEGGDGSYRGSVVGDAMSVVQSKKSPLKVPHRPKDSDTSFIPHDYISVPLKEEINEKTLVKDMATAEQLISTGLAKVASLRIKLQDMGSGEWAVNGKRVGGVRETLTKMAGMGIRVDSALRVINDVPTRASASIVGVQPHNITKLSSVFGKEAQPMDPAMMGQPMDPAMMGQPMDPAMMGGAPGQIEINPEFMNAAAALGDQGVFDSAAAAEVLQAPELSDIVAGYLPGLQKAMDQLGRILMALSVKQTDLVDELGIEQYTSMVRKVRQVFRGLGDIVLKLDRQTQLGESSSQVA